MKRILLNFIILIFVFTLYFTPSVFAKSVPTYEENFNNNVSAFFANGIPITISDVSGITTVSWEGGSKEISSNTLIFGGGHGKTFFESSNITMISGTVGSIYGGGFSISSDESAIVNNSSITINSGIINSSIIGGGLLYSQVDNSNIIMNDGSADYILGGGISNYTINGNNYSTGTIDNPKESGTVVKSVNITINNGTVEDLYGGGQGYSNTETSKLTINNGNFNYVTAGGTDGYTGFSDIKIFGGNINIYLSTNRGIVDKVKLEMTNGNIKDFYIGAEDAYDITGILNKINAKLLGGKIINLYSGLSNSVPLEVVPPNYIISFSNDVIENNHIPDLPNTNFDNIVPAIIISALLLYIIAISISIRPTF